MEFDLLIKELKTELTFPLPGREMQLAMSSIRRIREMMKWGVSRDARRSSVLILLYPGPVTGKPMIVLIRRPDYNGVHSGQISLPGGGFEEEDLDLTRTALRESHEEIGLDPGAVTILGSLTELFIPPSNYLVQPFVGYTSAAPEFRAHPREVKEILQIRLSDLMNDKNRKKKLIRLRTGIRILAPCYVIGENVIWGATAMILGEFREIVKRVRKRNSARRSRG
ncbi:MAG TPA: CoA pyrophosphatase [Bacteroidales bacterium]|nr:CoA pyrophosphatase [Bacteroidales bacterium]